MGNSHTNNAETGNTCVNSGLANVAQHLRELAAEVAEWKDATEEAPTEVLARWLAAHYAVQARRIARDAGDKGIDMDILRGLSADVVALRRGDHSAVRLRQEQEWLELEREKTEERMRMRFKEWVQDPANREWVLKFSMSTEERQEGIRRIFEMWERPKPVISPEPSAETEQPPHGREQ